MVTTAQIKQYLEHLAGGGAPKTFPVNVRIAAAAGGYVGTVDGDPRTRAPTAKGLALLEDEPK